MTERAVKRKLFEILDEFLAHFYSLKDESLVVEIRALCERVKQLVIELGISDRSPGSSPTGTWRYRGKIVSPKNIEGLSW